MNKTSVLLSLTLTILLAVLAVFQATGVSITGDSSIRVNGKISACYAPRVASSEISGDTFYVNLLAKSARCDVPREFKFAFDLSGYEGYDETVDYRVTVMTPVSTKSFCIKYTDKYPNGAYFSCP